MSLPWSSRCPLQPFIGSFFFCVNFREHRVESRGVGAASGNTPSMVQVRAGSK